MYIDQSIHLPESLPKLLKEEIEEMQEYYRNNDWLQFEMQYELIETQAKQCNLDGIISDVDLTQIFHYFGVYD